MPITLGLSDEVTRRAEQCARQHGRSLVGLVENYLCQVAQQSARPLAPAVQELYGILDLPAGFAYKTQRDERTSQCAISFWLPTLCSTTLGGGSQTA